MATILNITYQGKSADVPVALDTDVNEADIRRIAVEMIRSGGVPGLHVADMAAEAFDNYVVDRFANQGAKRLYLRPKVPFGVE